MVHLGGSSRGLAAELSHTPWAVADLEDVYGSSRCLRRGLLQIYCILNDSKRFPIVPTVERIHPFIVHCTMLCLTRPRTCTCTHTYYPYRLIPLLASDVLCRLAPLLEIEPLSEMILHAQRKEMFVPGARGGHVACATEVSDRALVEARRMDLPRSRPLVAEKVWGAETLDR